MSGANDCQGGALDVGNHTPVTFKCGDILDNISQHHEWDERTENGIEGPADQVADHLVFFRRIRVCTFERLYTMEVRHSRLMKQLGAPRRDFNNMIPDFSRR